MKVPIHSQYIYAAFLSMNATLGANLTYASNENAIEEVIVTAQKRAQSMQDVGIAVTAFTSDQIRDLRLSQAIDLASQTPGLEIKNSIGSSNPIITIRGVGLNDYHSNNNPSAAVHVDEVYLGSSAYLSFQMFDIERVEVLKGPQGTLYGRNSTAGTLNFITHKPSQEFDAHIDASYGNYNSSKIEAAIGGSLSSKVSARFAVLKEDSDGFQKNGGNAEFVGYSVWPGVIPAMTETPPSDNVNNTDGSAWRGSLLFEPNQDLEILASIHGSREDSGGPVYALQGFDFDGFDSESTGFEDTDGDIHTIYEDALPFLNSKGLGGQLRVDYNFGAATLTSITAYESIERDLRDGDGLPISFFSLEWTEDLWQKTQEIRLTSNSESNFQWITGFFYSEDEIDFVKTVISPNLILSNWETDYVQTNDSWAAFAHSEWQFNDEFKLTTGLRYTEDSRDYSGGTSDLDPWGVYNGGVPYVMLRDTLKVKEDDLSGKVGLDWTPNNDWLFYGSISKGFKSGGFDGSTVRKPGDLKPFSAETLWSYELGFKSTLRESTLQVNGSFFVYDFQDMQAEALVYVAGIPNTIRLNAGDVEMSGAEIDLWWRPLSSLDVKLGVSLLDSEVTKWIGEEAEIYEGNNPPDTPELTLNGMVRYQWVLDSGLILAALTDFSYKDETYTEIENIEKLKKDGYIVWNAQMSLTSSDESWTVALWGKNLGDKEYETNTFGNLSGVGQSRYVMYGAPRTYGMSVNYNWN